MPAGTSTFSEATPAWPTLLGVQLVIAAALVGLGWRVQQIQLLALAPPPPVEVRLQQLDVPSATAAVEARISEVATGQAMRSADERHLASFLSLSARAAGFQVTDVGFVEGVVTDGLLPIDAHLALEGNVFDLPVFLDVARRQRAVGHLQRIDAKARPGGMGELGVVIRYFRPTLPDTEWVSERLRLAAPGADRAAHVLQRAAVLRTWRQFRGRVSTLRDGADGANQSSRLVLPVNLIAMWEKGGELHWTADGDLMVALPD